MSQVYLIPAFSTLYNVSSKYWTGLTLSIPASAHFYKNITSHNSDASQKGITARKSPLTSETESFRLARSYFPNSHVGWQEFIPGAEVFNQLKPETGFSLFSSGGCYQANQPVAIRSPYALLGRAATLLKHFLIFWNFPGAGPGADAALHGWVVRFQL